MNTTGQSPKTLDDIRSLLKHPLDFSLLRLPAVSISMPDAPCRTYSSRPDPAGFIPALPIVVGGNSEKGFVIIDGYRRYTRLAQDSSQKIDCLLLAPAPDEFHRGLLRILFNRTREKTPGELISALSWLRKRIAGEHLAGSASLLGFSSREIELAEPLLESPPRVVECLEKGTLNTSVIPDLWRLSHAEQVLFCTKILPLGLSCQMQREFIQWLPDIAHIKGCTIREIFADDKIQSLLIDTHRNNPQKAAALRASLFSERFPRFSAAQTQWNKTARKANPAPKQIRFIPSDGLEKNRLEVRCTFSDTVAIRTILRGLQEIDDATWGQLISPAGGPGEP